MSEYIGPEPGNDIAIIGMAGRFPGARNIDQFWLNLREGRESITFFSDEELLAAGVSPALLRDANYVRAAPQLDDIEMFDRSFFGFSPKQAELTDPQHRIFMECAWEALEHAGYAPNRIGVATGVYAGCSMSYYLYSNLMPNLNGQASGAGLPTLIGNDKDYLATHVSYKLNLKGPSISIQTACSTSLVAVHLACQGLLNGECDLALAGGVTVHTPQLAGYLYVDGGILSPDGHCRAFDAQAQGTIFGNGVGLVVLRRLSDALRDHDYIHAVIKGSAVNNDGSAKVGYTAPSVEGQARVIAEALAIADVKPETITYLETHGTGTAIGDPIEVTALTQAFRSSTKAKRFCAIGSVKTNFGHLEAAAGIASLIKTVLALKHEELPPSLHFHRPNPQIDFDNSPFYVNARLSPWVAAGKPRRAGVSSFGIGGTNAHLVLEEAPAREREAENDRTHHIFCLSAKTESALATSVDQFRQYLATDKPEALADICYTANTGRAHLPHRLAIVAKSREELRDKLDSFHPIDEIRQTANGPSGSRAKPNLAFLFTGQASQYANMGRRLYETEPVFEEALRECDRLLRPHLEHSLLSVLYPASGTDDLLEQQQYAQPALIALEYALTQLWRAWGIEPALLMGHSLGEYAAACVAGVLSLKDCLWLVSQRGRLMQTLDQDGAMATVFASQEQVAAAIADFPGEVSIAAINGPEMIVISGLSRVVQAVREALAFEHVRSQLLPTTQAFHSPLMVPILDEFTAKAAQPKYSPPSLPIVSSLSGQLVTADLISADYWRRNTREPVNFTAGVRMLREQGCQLFLELGPSPTLSVMGKRCLPEGSDTWLHSLRQGHDDWREMLASLSSLYIHGMEGNWSRVSGSNSHRRVVLPTYPFQRARCWVEVNGNKRQAFSVEQPRNTTEHPLLGQRLRSPLNESLFESRLSTMALPFLAEHRIHGIVVVPATAYFEMAMAAAAEVLAPGSHTFEEVIIHEALTLRDDESCVVQSIVIPHENGEASFQLFSEASDQPAQANAWQLHAAGKLRTVPAGSAAQPQGEVTLEELKKRFQEQVPTDAYYQKLRDQGIDYGASFQAIEKLWRGDGEALGLIVKPAALESESNSYQLHPALLDACLQVVGAALINELGATTDSDIYLPLGTESFRTFATAKDRVWSHAVFRPLDAANHETAIADVQVFDEWGQLVAEVRGLLLKRARREALLRRLQKQPDDWFYEIKWQPKMHERTGATREKESPGQWLIFGDRNGTGQALSAQLVAQNQTCTLIFAGAGFVISAPGQYTIDPNNPEDYQRVLEAALSNSDLPCRGVVNLWGLQETVEHTDLSALRSALTLGCGSTLWLVQAMARTRWPQAPKLWLITRSAQSTGTETTPIAVAQAPLWGLGRVIALEHLEFWGGLIDLDAAAALDEGLSLADELLHPSNEDQIAFRAGQRYVTRLVRKQLPPPPEQQFQLRSDSTYLIAGGLGGLGLTVARWMVERGARNLVLMSRSPATDVAGNQLKELAQMGAQVNVAQADVSQVEQVAGALKMIAEDMPPLRGIVHAAGTLADGLLLRQDWDRFASVLAPKIEGAWNLHRLTIDEPLDFFILFSSAVSVIGSPGQGNYAAANSFLDALAHQRRASGLAALSINWGPWAEVGMAATVNGSGAHNLFKDLLTQISPQQGTRLLEQLMGSTAPAQVAVMSARWSLLTDYAQPDHIPGLLSDLVAEAGRQRKPVNSSGPNLELLRRLKDAPPKKRLELLLAHLQNEIVITLGLDPSRPPDGEQKLFDLGMDSLMAIELRARLQTALGSSLPATMAFDYPTLDLLVRYLAEEVLGLDTGATTTQKNLEKDEQEAVLDKIESLSDEETEAMLLEKLTSLKGRIAE